MTTLPKQTVNRLLTIAGMLAGAAALAWMLGTDPLGPGDLSGRVSDSTKPWRWALVIGRWSLWGSLWIQWIRIGERLFKGDSEQAAAQKNQWHHMRHRMLGGIAVVEIIILINTVSGDKGWE